MRIASPLETLVGRFVGRQAAENSVFVVSALGWKIFFNLPFQYRGFDAFSVSQHSKWICFSCSKGFYYSYNHFDNSSNNIFDKRISILNVSKMKNVEK